MLALTRYIFRVKDESGDNDKPKINRSGLQVRLLNSIPGCRVCSGYSIQHVQKEPDETMSVYFMDKKFESGLAEHDESEEFGEIAANLFRKLSLCLKR